MVCKLSKLIDDNHRNAYTKCISDLTAGLDEIASDTVTQFMRLVKITEKDLRIIDDARRTTEKILGIFETSRKSIYQLRSDFLESYDLWLQDCHNSTDNQVKTNSTVVIDLEDQDVQILHEVDNVKIVTEVKYHQDSQKALHSHVKFQNHDGPDVIDISSSPCIPSHLRNGLVHNRQREIVGSDWIETRESAVMDKSIVSLPDQCNVKGECREISEQDSSKKHENQSNLSIDCGHRNNDEDYLNLTGEESQANTSTDLSNLKIKSFLQSDIKLRLSSFVSLERLPAKIDKKFRNQERKPVKPSSEDDPSLSSRDEQSKKASHEKQGLLDPAFLRLIDLSNLERKRIYSSSSDSSTSSTSGDTNHSVKKKRKNSSNDSDVSSYYESSDSDSNDNNDDMSYERLKLDERNFEKEDDSEEKAKLLLLAGSDSTDSSDETTDNGDDECENSTKKKKLSKKSSKKSSTKSKPDWMNDELLTFKLDDDRGAKKINSKNSNTSDVESTSSNSTVSRPRRREAMKRKYVETSEPESSESEGDSESSTPDDDRDVKNQSDNSEDTDGEEANNDLETTTLSLTQPDSKTPGRRNIRKVLDDQEITEITKEAVRDEEGRLQRLAQRKEQLNSLVGCEKNRNSMILDFDFKNNKVLVAVDRGLVELLKDHQKEGVRFLWDSCFESVEQAKKDNGSGCILAHCMGLGKTLQIITLVHTVLVNKAIGVKTAMIVCPKNTVLNWVEEFKMWLEHVKGQSNIKIVELTRVQKPALRINRLKNWQQVGGVLIISYNAFLSFTKTSGRKLTPNQKQSMRQLLIYPGADLIVCDEGHLLKNEESHIADRMQQVKTQRRIILTGTPLQNNLIEYHCMVQFVKPHLLGSKAEFVNRFANPIKNGQYENSTPGDVKLMKHRAHVLHRLLEGCVQRRDYTVLKPLLPEKQEYVILIRLSKLQCQLYEHFISNIAKAVTKNLGVFKNYHEIKRLVAHPKTMQMKAEQWKPAKPKPKRRKKNNLSFDEEEEEEDDGYVRADIWWNEFVKEEDFEDVTVSYKLMLLFGILESCAERQDKILVFSQCLLTLNLIELFLKKLSSRNNESSFNFNADWVHGLDYFRIDGKITCEKRSRMCEKFNDPKNTRARLFLISTKAGGLGINLTGANRVVVFDPSWNPSDDLQSIFRVFRFGQEKECFIYRFLTAGTMEEKIYNRQITKLSLSLRVVDEQQVERHYSNKDLTELYELEPLPEKGPVLNVPSDDLLAEVFSKYGKYVYKYFEHDSLLENKEDEELNEEERKQAWFDYQKEKFAQPAIDASIKPNRKKNSETSVESAKDVDAPATTINGISDSSEQ